MLCRALALSSGLAVAILSAGCSGSPAAIGATPLPNRQGSVSASPSAATQSASPEASASATTSASTPVHFASRCTSSQLTLGWGGRISEPTGQHSLSLTLTNSSHAGCHLFGYPGVSFVDPGGRVLPLRYVWGGDQVVTSSKPVMVDLPGWDSLCAGQQVPLRHDRRHARGRGASHTTRRARISTSLDHGQRPDGL